MFALDRYCTLLVDKYSAMTLEQQRARKLEDDVIF